MSEKIYALLLRLYPASFRRRYQAEALQLLTDRLCDERGFLRRLRLWTDLLLDLIFGLPTAYQNTYSAAGLTPQPEIAQGIPEFRMLEQVPLRPGALLMGSMGTVVVLGLLIFMVNHAGEYHPQSAEKGQFSSIERVMQRLNQPLIPQPERGNESASHSTSAARTAISAGKAPNSPQTSGRTVPLSPPPATRVAKRATATHNAVKDAIAQNLNRQEQLPIPMTVQAAAKVSKHKALEASTPIRRFVTENGNASQSAGTLRSHSPGYNDQPKAIAILPITRRRTTPSPDCMLDQVKTLPANVGYLKLSWFADVSTCRTVVQGVMSRFDTTDVVILDLRDCAGGDPGMIRMLAQRLAGKRVFVLASSRTFSGEEHFSDTLKQLKRSTIIGESTGGQSGIKPDIHATDALQTAEKLARTVPHRK